MNHFRLFFSSQWAPNTCIGGSGTRAIDIQSFDTSRPFQGNSLACEFPASSARALGPRVDDNLQCLGCHCLTSRTEERVSELGCTFSLSSSDLCWCAPNTCIGGSGTRAASMSQVSVGRPAYHSLAVGPRAGLVSRGCSYGYWTLWLICLLQQYLGSFFRSFALLTLFMLVALLVRPFKARTSPRGFVLGGHIVGLRLQPLRACAVATPSTPVLDWRSRSRRGRREHRQNEPFTWITGRTLRILSFLIGSIPRAD